MEDVTLFTQAECMDIRDTVHRLRECWINRMEGHPYFTLGATSYLDMKDDPSGKLYEERAATFNPILQKELGWFYDRIFQNLETRLESPIFLADKFAMPGFLIFLAHPHFQRDDIAYRHFDIPYDLLQWRDRELLDLTNPLSFTVAVWLPKHGGGIYTWDIPYVKDRSAEEVLAMSNKMPRNLYRYTLGNMIVHSGHHLHQIAPFLILEPEDERITLQGHLIRYDGKWVYYL